MEGSNNLVVHLVALILLHIVVGAASFLAVSKVIHAASALLFGHP